MSSPRDKADPTAATESVIAPGRVIGDRYVLDERLGSGAMGQVWRAHHRFLDVRVALKLFTFEAQRQPGFEKRFLTECAVPGQIAASEGTHSPALACFVRHHDAGIDRVYGVAFIAMDLLVGEDLEAVHVRGPLPPEQVVDFIGQVARGLDAAHAISYVHRDIKPANLFLCRGTEGRGTIKIIDWGIARLENPAASRTLPFATWPYCAPEQARGLGSLDGRADVFSLAMTAFSLLTGKRYYEIEIERGADPICALLGPREAGTVRAAQYGARLPPAFDDWFKKGTAAEPTDRYDFASELASGLADVFGLDWIGPPLPTPQPWPKDQRTDGKRRAKFSWVALAVASGVALAMVATLILLRSDGTHVVPRPTAPKSTEVSVVAPAPTHVEQPSAKSQPSPVTSPAPLPAGAPKPSMPSAGNSKKRSNTTRSKVPPEDEDPSKTRWPE
jgi:serine/threonine-protein kinase